MTPAEYRAAFERELGLTLDLEARDTLLEALRLGPGSLAWRDALAIVDLRETARRQMTSPTRRREVDVHRDISRDLRRGRFVGVVARALIAALILATFFVLGAYGMPALWRS